MRRREKPPPGSLPGSLLREGLADPHRLPEHLALLAVRRLGPVARRTASAEPPPDRAGVIRRGRRATVTEGAFVGGPFLLLIPVAFCAALLRQTRICLELAALTGRDPTDLERAAELLVLQGVYDDVGAARAALAVHARAPSRGVRPTALWTLTLRMARLLGLLVPDEPGAARPGPWIQTGRWLLLAAVILVGTVAPLIWLPYMARSYDRATRQLTRRAERFYFPGEPDATSDAMSDAMSDPLPDTVPDTPAGSGRRRRVDPARLAGAGRALLSVLSLLVPVVLVFGVVVADVRIAGSRWPVLGIVLVTGSVVTGGVWWLRHRRGSATGGGGDG
ncbi:hypothetical protein [Streptomyces antibioticus]|uniref:Uncharacterized protein n=1 Tax=Streptomyces antibioticus TaxID=1890 RepID=A0AAE6Y9U4_STRAT|nr:hypothetical protein [Streptomyces antibioticus]OOQ50248.1 hypothetical protein AFM16_20430 [Streptomyces antibioticus]QIT45670.1 hypothetical protein HCX60_20780 [Streptomyces antibioticus]